MPFHGYQVLMFNFLPKKFIKKLSSWVGYKPAPTANNKYKYKPIPETITEWCFEFIQTAIQQSDQGRLKLPAQLCDGIQRDCVASGVLSTRTDGLVRLPIKWTGNDKILLSYWEGTENRKSIYSKKVPTAESVKMLADGILLGVSLGEMCPVVGPDPYVDSVLQRVDPQFIEYDRIENCLYYCAGERIKITPGDGRWVVYAPGGLNEPWKRGKWLSLAEPFIGKISAFYNSQGYASKFANPARVAYTPLTSTQRDRELIQDGLINWGINQSFTLPENYEIKLLESSGKGWEIFKSQIESSNQDIMIALAGQVVTTLGNPGFSNGYIHQAIRADLIQSSAESFAECINQQIIVPWVNKFFGADAIKNSPELYWDTTPPTDLAAEADTLTKVGSAVSSINSNFAAYKKRLNLLKLEEKFNLDLEDIVEPTQPITPPLA